ncbi:hypothetical protein [Helicobacter turcicus]|uniref:hypothetical protein n=1 Tax=Helicobacter turcicus TaxID=2867412 RepID=UPI001C8862C1|nr:hypothetical protein [Helicobacter turcicus]MBX7545290.1 hypothetical protein [Helicobacter turcicus]
MHWNIFGRLIKKEIYDLSLECLGVANTKEKINYAEDVLVSFAIFNHCKTFCFLSEILYYYRYNAESISRCKSLENLKRNANDFLKVIKIMQNFIAHNTCDKRLAKVFVSQAKHEYGILNYHIRERGGVFVYLG